MDQSANHDLAALQQRAAAADCMIRTQGVVMNQKDVLTLGGYIQQLADGQIPRATGQLNELLRRAGV